MKGRIYTVRVMKSRTQGIPLVYILTFREEASHCNAFIPHSFESPSGCS